MRQIIIKNILKEDCHNNILRLRIKKDEYWYTTKNINELINEIIIIEDIKNIKKIRRQDKYDEESPSIKIVLSKDLYNNNTWVFLLWRHDVMDGFKLTQIAKHCFSKGELLYKKILLKYNKKNNIIITLSKNIFFTLYSLINYKNIIPKKIKGKRTNYYLHLSMNLDYLKSNAKLYKLKFGDYISCIYIEAFFKSYPNRNKCIFASLTLTDGIEGNNYAVGINIINREDNLKDIIKSFKQSSKILFFSSLLCSSLVMNNYKIMPKIIREAFDSIHERYDFISSNLPGLDSDIEPKLYRRNAVRETDIWKPSIFYGIGNGDTYALDNYWSVFDDFDKNAFETSLKNRFKPFYFTNELPIGY